MQGLSDKARALRQQGLAIRDVPILSRMAAAGALGDAVADLLVQMADRIEALTPYADEITADQIAAEDAGGRDDA